MANLETKTPTSPFVPSENPLSISDRINIATRPVHTQLNRLILARLPLALPPHSANPSVYVSGLLHIAPIYITFETLWSRLLNAPPLPTSLNQAVNSCEAKLQQTDPNCIPTIPETRTGIIRPDHASKVCSRTHSLLAHLRLPEMLRAERLKADISILTGTSEHELDGQLEAISKNGRLAEFIAHTTRSVNANPHVLLASAWVLYMAIFSGGRYLRASLKEAGGVVDFWSRELSPVRPYSITRVPAQEQQNSRRSNKPESPESRSYSASSDPVPGLSFFNFPGTRDGEDLKAEFKKRIAEVEVLLTEGEKVDIVQEAQEIFHFMVEMVDELENVMSSSAGEGELALTPAGIQSGAEPIFKNQRDSLVVHKERMLNSSSSPSRSGDTCPVAIEMPRKRSFLQAMFTDPVTAKFVHFNENCDAVISPLKTRLSDDVGAMALLADSPIASEQEHKHKQEQRKLYPAWDSVVRGLTTLLPLGTLVVVFLAWRFMEKETERMRERAAAAGFNVVP